MPGDNAYSRTDRSSYSNPSEILSTVIHLDWTLDFDTKQIYGSVTHGVVVVIDGSDTVKFDSSSLTISSVEINSTKVGFKTGVTSTALGTCIEVPIPESLRAVGTEFEVKFNYSTSPTASAVQWLSAKTTSSGKFPFVFTQCQAIHARSLMPCQDTPGVKTTYTATVRAPEWCVVLMSALEDPISKAKAKPGEFHWRQPVPIPAYLVALAAGELESREISKRVKVWAEPSVVDKAAFEFSETEEFLQAAESLTCPYPWTRYDVLCLPPSFPYGGMENPCLTFATPTLLAGDKSLADVIAHEIAHSWTGNLVTNCTWEHFWLNEGWTVWLERKIMSRVKGDVAHLKLSAQIGWNHLRDSVAQLGGETGRFTRLVWPLEGEDPDDAFSSVPYEKGFNLLWYLESLVGTPAFEEFAKNYIDKFKFGGVSSGEFKDMFMSTFAGHSLRVDSLNWDELFYSTGMPTPTPDFSNPLSDSALRLADRWIATPKDGNAGASGAGPTDIEGWSSQQKCVFLEKLILHAQEVAPFSLAVLEAMDLAYGLTSSNNAEIKFRWQSLCLESEAPWIVPHIVAFVKAQGRMKFVRPLYRALHKSAVGCGMAKQTFIENNEIYHPIARKMVAADLGLDLNELGKTKQWKDIPPASSSTPARPNPNATQSQPEDSMGWAVPVAVAAGVAAVAILFLKFRR